MTTAQSLKILKVLQRTIQISKKESIWIIQNSRSHSESQTRMMELTGKRSTKETSRSSEIQIVIHAVSPNILTGLRNNWAVRFLILYRFVRKNTRQRSGSSPSRWLRQIAPDFKPTNIGSSSSDLRLESPKRYDSSEKPGRLRIMLVICLCGLFGKRTGPKRNLYQHSGFVIAVFPEMRHIKRRL